MFRPLEALQDEALAKESRKLAERQARDRARVQRFMDARQRTIGVDASALAAQLEEKERLKELELAAARAEAERAARINGLLDAHEAQERGTRQALLQSLGREWQEQAAAQRGRNKPDRAFLEPGMTPAACGLGAMQKLAGEDEGFAERRRERARLQREWVREQLGERAAAARAAAAQEAASVAESAQVRTLLERHATAEAAYRAALTEAVQAENRAAAARQRAAEGAAAAARRAEEAALLERGRRDPMLSEVNDFVSPETGHIRVDRFRGYTAAQRARMLAENAAVVEEKARRRAAERAAEAAWAEQQEAWGRRLEGLQQAEEAARKELERSTRAALEEQEKEHRLRAAKARADAFGRIEQGEGLHSKFGTSLA